MLKEHDHVFRRLLIIIDLLVIGAAFQTAYLFRNHLNFLFPPEMLPKLYNLDTYLGLMPMILTLWGVFLYSFNAYDTFRVKTMSQILSGILKSAFFAGVIFGSAAYLLKLHHVSRILILVGFGIATVFLFLERLIFIHILHFMRKNGYNFRYLLIVGTGPRAESFMALIGRHPEWGLKIAGLVDDDPEMLEKQILGHKVIGTLIDLPRLLEHEVVDEVVFIVPRAWLGKIENSVLHCEQLGKRVSIAIDLFTMKFAQAKQSGLPGFPLLMFQSTTDKLGQLLVKRLLDIVISFFAIVLLSPVLLIFAILVKATSPGPVFFKQTRSTLNGRIFTLYKFRTMVADAEHKLESLRNQNEMEGPVFKMTSDPRVTPLGKWMRKFSIDEFPQFWNVLKGDMSVVGPRPPIPKEVTQYESWQRRRLSMRPGLTCIWQIKGRNKIVNFDEWMKLDLEYIDQWSLWLDLKIFLQTIPIVLFGIGAK